ncbi:MAG: cell division protein FtsA [Chloroflexi bacterium]|nr:cell division protein FtsA [Chloroflexota bacterium]
MGGCGIARDHIIVGVDIGSTKVCTLIADVGGEQPEVLGVGICPSQGIRKGIVVDVQAAANTVSTSLRRAEQQSGFKAMRVFLGVTGAHISSTNTRAVVAVRDPSNVIGPDDVSRVIDVARVIQLPADQEILHVIPHHYIVDGTDEILDPTGMLGRRLEIEATIITGSTTPIHNLMRCIESAEVEADGLVLEPLAAGRAVLSAAERDAGALVVDMGGGTTDAAIFRDGRIVHACVLPVGGYQLDNDLAFGLRTALPVAEEIKIRHGSTLEHVVRRGERIHIEAYGRNEGQDVEQYRVAEIIDARLAETLELLGSAIDSAGFGGAFPAGVVLTGGCSLIAGAPSLASEILQAPARVGMPENLMGLADAIRSPSFAASAGLLEWGKDQLVPPSRNGEGAPGPLDGLRAWLRSFLT